MVTLACPHAHPDDESLATRGVTAGIVAVGLGVGSSADVAAASGPERRARRGTPPPTDEGPTRLVGVS